MTNIKVTYGSTARRLTISSTTTWSELETQLRNLFNIPQEIPTTVSYTDEEGDIITLSSDLELQEALSSSFNNTGTIKFVLTTSNENNLNNNEGSIDTVVDEETSNLINGVSSIQIEEPKESNNNNHRHVSISDEVDVPLFNQQQYPSQETPGEVSKKATKSTDNNTDNNNNNTQENNSSEENQENSDDDDIIIIIARNPWSHRRRERFGGCNPYYYDFGGRSRHGCHFNYNTSNTGGCNRSASSRGYGCGGRYNRRNHQISPEVMAEKINTLSSMGFAHDNLEELVRRNNGNLENVIEVLLFNQQNEQNNGKGGEENGQPMEVEEENRPYVL